MRRSSLIPAGFLVSRGTRVSYPERRKCFAYGAITLFGMPSHAFLLPFRFLTFRQFRKTVRSDPATPHMQRFRAITHMRFGLFPFRSPLLRKSLLFSSPGVTEMFQFAPFASPPYVFGRRCPDIARDGFPHSEISGSEPVWRLPGAYRSLPRPSSPPGTKASAVCPW